MTTAGCEVTTAGWEVTRAGCEVSWALTMPAAARAKMAVFILTVIRDFCVLLEERLVC